MSPLLASGSAFKTFEEPPFQDVLRAFLSLCASRRAEPGSGGGSISAPKRVPS
jgi:hypothetical protein